MKKLLKSSPARSFTGSIPLIALCCLVTVSGFIFCTKESTETPRPPPQPRWIVINVDYAAQTGVNYVTLNGKQIMGRVVAGRVKVDSVDNSEGELIINLSGGVAGILSLSKSRILLFLMRL